MNTVTIPFLVDGTDRLAEVKLERLHVGHEDVDTWSWEWGIVDTTGYTRIDQGIVQHKEHLGLFNLLYRILGLVLNKKGAQ